MLAAERLGGADYDGDMIKTIADPLLNECVKRNFRRKKTLPGGNRNACDPDGTGD